MAPVSVQQFDGWLLEQPSSFASVITARSCLRTLPGVCDERHNIQFHGRIMLPMFESAALLRYAALWPSREITVPAKSARSRISEAARYLSNDKDAKIWGKASSRSMSFAVSPLARGIIDLDSSLRAVKLGGEMKSSAAVSVYWENVFEDAEQLERGLNSPSEVLQKPLWRDDLVPSHIREKWMTLAQGLIDADQHWEVWTNWYRDLLDGHQRADEKFERSRITIEHALWETGARSVNKALLEREAAYEKQLITPPDARRATIEATLGNDGLLHLKSAGGPEFVDGRIERRLRFAWGAIRDHLNDIIETGVGNNSLSLKSAMKALDRALAKSFDEMDVIACGIHGARVSAISTNADKFLPDDLAEDIKFFGVSFDAFMRQFPDWVDYLASAADEPTKSDIDAAIILIREAFEKAKLIGDDLKAALSEYAHDFEDILYSGAAFVELHKIDFINCVNNVLVAIVNILTPSLAAWKEQTKEGFLDAYKDVVKYSTYGLLIEAAAKFSVLPKEFMWFTRLLEFWGKSGL